MDAPRISSIVAPITPAPVSESAHDIPFANPLTDAHAASSIYALPPAVVAFALDQFAKRFPSIDRAIAYRLLEVALSVSGEVPWMVYAHEQGHARVGRNFGWDVDVTLTSPWSGYTTGAASMTAKQNVAFVTGGVNQGQLNALKMYRDWARNGDTSYQEALAYLLAQTNLALYAARTSLSANLVPGDDIKAYVDDMRRRGENLHAYDLAAQAAAATLLSAPFWAALLGGIGFIARGERRVALPRVEIAGVKLTLPNVHYMLGARSRIVGVTSVVDWGQAQKLEVSAEVGTNGKSGAIGLRLDDLPLASNLSLSPFIRLTGGQAPGVYGGADIDFRLSDRVSLSAEAVYRDHDIRAPIEGAPNGWSATDGVRVRF